MSNNDQSHFMRINTTGAQSDEDAIPRYEVEEMEEFHNLEKSMNEKKKKLKNPIKLPLISEDERYFSPHEIDYLDEYVQEIKFEDKCTDQFTGAYIHIPRIEDTSSFRDQGLSSFRDQGHYSLCMETKCIDKEKTMKHMVVQHCELYGNPCDPKDNILSIYCNNNKLEKLYNIGFILPCNLMILLQRIDLIFRDYPTTKKHGIHSRFREIAERNRHPNMKEWNLFNEFVKTICFEVSEGPVHRQMKMKLKVEIIKSDATYLYERVDRKINIYRIEPERGYIEHLIISIHLKKDNNHILNIELYDKRMKLLEMKEIFLSVEMLSMDVVL